MEAMHIDCWQHLEQLGIRALTAEACAYNMRVLCDVNEDGRALLLDYFGLPPSSALATAWNGSVQGKDTVGSFMLHRSALLPLAEFGMRRMNAEGILFKDKHAVVGLFTPDLVDKYSKLISEWPETTKAWTLQVRPKGAGPSVGSRNVHMATGRVA
jgi:hypothetical protein